MASLGDGLKQLSALRNSVHRCFIAGELSLLAAAVITLDVAELDQLDHALTKVALPRYNVARLAGSDR